MRAFLEEFVLFPYYLWLRWRKRRVQNRLLRLHAKNLELAAKLRNREGWS